MATSEIQIGPCGYHINLAANLGQATQSGLLKAELLLDQPEWVLVLGVERSSIQDWTSESVEHSRRTGGNIDGRLPLAEGRRELARRLREEGKKLPRRGRGVRHLPAHGTQVREREPKESPRWQYASISNGHAPQQAAERFALDQQAADEVRGNDFGGAGEEDLGEGVEGVDSFGSGFMSKY